MTTEIVARMNDGLDKDAAIAAIKSDYGFADDVDITKDYIVEKVTICLCPNAQHCSSYYCCSASS